EGHQDDLAGIKDGADPHGQGLHRHVFFAEKAAGGIAAGHRIEADQAGAAMTGGAGVVEADVATTANAQNLQVDAAGPANLLLVIGAVILDFFRADSAVRQMDVLRLDVDVIEERLLHPPSVAVRAIGLYRAIFVEVEADDTGKIEAGFL